MQTNEKKKYIITDQLRIRDYLLLVLSENPNLAPPYNHFLIKGKYYKPVSVYDLPRNIAIKTDESLNLVGEEVEFVLLDK